MLRRPLAGLAAAALGRAPPDGLLCSLPGVAVEDPVQDSAGFSFSLMDRPKHSRAAS
uniref:Guanylate kinase 1 n=2 Tax=Homo sapiens TaxID=9606 RepID=A0A9L9PY36_HUMAN